MTGITKGPWNWNPETGFITAPPSEHFAHGQPIAKVSGGPGKNAPANARAMAEVPSLIAALKEARQWIAKGLADGAYNGCAAPLAPNRWIDRCGAILSRIDGAGDTLPDAPVPAPTGEEPYALKAARGYASNPEQWNPPSPEQMAEILAMIDRKGEN